MRTSASLLLLGIGLSAGADESSLWLHADFDRPLVIDGRICDVKMKEGRVEAGKFGSGYAFVSEKTRCDDDFISISDPDLLESYPFEEGSFSCFYRLPDGAAPADKAPFFCYGGFWQYQWAWDGASFACENLLTYNGRLGLNGACTPSSGWRHFCATWTADELVCYADGVEIASKRNPTRVDMRRVARAHLRIGTCGEGAGPANLVADEISIYRRALTAAEVRALSVSSAPACADDRILPGRIAFPIYWRNQRDAALRMRLWSPKAAVGTFRLTIGGREVAVTDRTVAPGLSDLAIPFDPSRFRPGAYAYRLELRAADGTVLLSDGGTVEIRGRVEGDAFRLLSWGGSTTLSRTNLVALGLNSVNVLAAPADRSVRDYLRQDVFINWRLENSTSWKDFGFDEAAIAAEARERLADGEGLHLWRSTLVNSEVYNANVSAITNDLRLLERAQAALGSGLDVNTRREPEQLDYAKKGIAPYSGVMPSDDPTLRTIWWFVREGFPVYAVNRADRAAIRELSPGNVVWSEPSPEPVGLDMVSDWAYSYKAENVLQTLRRDAAQARVTGVLNQPTLSMSYYGDFPPAGTHPRTGEAVSLAQSCDELMVKSWMALGAVRADHISYFAADSWEDALRTAGLLNGDPSASLAYSSAVRGTVGETDAIPRFGEFVRTRFRPAAELLRGIEPVRSRVALVWLDETDRAGRWDWSRYHYRNQVADFLSRQPWAWDYVTDRELTADRMKDYDYVLLPMLNVITDRHDAELRALPPTVRLVLDGHAARLDYPRETRLDDMLYRAGSALEFNPAGVDGPLGAFFADKTESLRRAQTAWSEEDGTNAYTFVKERKGVSYVTVVNNARRAGGTPMNLFNTNAWYRPCGAPQTITTHFAVPAGGCVYEFNAGGRRAAAIETRAYRPGEGAVYCIYPRPLTGLSVRLPEIAAGTRVAMAQIEVRDAAGLAPGRQVVEVTVRRPDGARTDESGLYRVEDGCCEVALRLSDEDSAAGGGWSVTVRELTSGLRAFASTGPQGFRTWTGAVSSDWSDPANWSAGADGISVPADGESVRIGGAAAATVSVTNGLPYLAALEIGDAAGPVTVTLSGEAASLCADTVRIGARATVTCEPCDWEARTVNRVRIVCRDLTVAAGGVLDVSGRGWKSPQDTAAYHAGYGPGRYGNYRPGGAPSHGGHGSRILSMDYGGATPLPYDDPADPHEPGSSGTTSPWAVGGNGGGVVRIEATGLVTVDGAIRADGRNASAYGAAGWSDFADAHDGAGSGGAVNLSCRRLTGSGEISARGGGGGCVTASIPGMPAGGGMIALRYDPSVQTAEALADLTVTAAAGLCRRGNSHGGQSPTTWFETHAVDADDSRTSADIGTVWMADGKPLDAILGKSLTGQVRGVADYVRTGDLVFAFGHVRFAEEGAHLHVTGSVVLDGADSRLEIGGAFATNRSAYVDLCSRQAPRLTVGGDVTLGGVSRLDVRAAETDGPGTFGAFVRVGGTLTVGTNCAIYAWSDLRTLGAPSFEVGSLAVEAGGLLSAFRRGGAGGFAPAATGVDLPDATYGQGPGGGRSATVGGGHGGAGGFASAAKGGLPYDDEQRPREAGSGGGGGYNQYTLGGFGGGLIYVRAPAGRIRIDGTVTADGEDGTLGNGFAGGGSGGAIHFEARRFSCGETAVLSACGGATKPHASVQSGSGGGGRIAVWSSPASLRRMVGTYRVSAGDLIGSNAGERGADGTCLFCPLESAGAVVLLR